MKVWIGHPSTMVTFLFIKKSLKSGNVVGHLSCPILLNDIYAAGNQLYTNCCQSVLKKNTKRRGNQKCHDASIIDGVSNNCQAAILPTAEMNIQDRMLLKLDVSLSLNICISLHNLFVD